MEHGLKKLIALSIIASLAFVFSWQRSAAADSGERARILKTVRAIEQKLDKGNYSDKELQRIERKLQDVLDILDKQQPRGRAGKRRAECVDFAYTIYKRVMIGTRAMEQSVRQCKGRIDMGVVKVLYGIFRKSSIRTKALEQALNEVRGHRVKGKLELIQYAYGVIRKSQVQNKAIRQAVRFADRVPRGSLDCVKRAFASYKRSNVASKALGKAFKLCE